MSRLQYSNEATLTASRIMQLDSLARLLESSTLVKTGAGVLTLSASGAYTLTVPATGTAALLNRVGGETFTTAQTISGSVTATNGNLTVDDTLTGFAAGIISDARILTTVEPSSTPLGTDYFALYVQALTANDATDYYSSNSSVRSFYMEASHQGSGNLAALFGAYTNLSNQNSGTIIDANGYYSNALVTNGLIYNRRGLQVINATITGGAIHYQYGVFINALTSGDWDNFAIYTQGATKSYFGGNIGLGTETPGAKLHISLENATTNAIDTTAIIAHNSTGTAANGFGARQLITLESSTTADTNAAALDVSWVDATHATRKAKIQIKTWDTAERSGLAIEADGAAQDVYFEGGAGSGLPYGSCYGNEIGWTQAAAVQNTWYVISDADMADGQLNLVAHDGSGKLTVTKAGRYNVAIYASAECSALNKHVQLGISVNGAVVDCTPHYEVSSPNAQLIMATGSIVVCAASGYIEAAIRTTDIGTPDLSVDHLAIVISQVGG